MPPPTWIDTGPADRTAIPVLVLLLAIVLVPGALFLSTVRDIWIAALVMTVLAAAIVTIPALHLVQATRCGVLVDTAAGTVTVRRYRRLRPATVVIPLADVTAVTLLASEHRVFRTVYAGTPLGIVLSIIALLTPRMETRHSVALRLRNTAPLDLTPVPTTTPTPLLPIAKALAVTLQRPFDAA